MRSALRLSLVCASLLAGACYDSGSSGGGAATNAPSICPSFCAEKVEQACDTQTVEACSEGCEFAFDALGPCGPTYRAVIQCAVNVGFTCDADGSILLQAGCETQFQDYNTCVQTNFDAGV